MVREVWPATVVQLNDVKVEEKTKTAPRVKGTLSKKVSTVASYSNLDDQS